MRNIIVTAADENFADLLVDLLDSLQQWSGVSFGSIGVLDVGLSEATAKVIEQRVTYLRQPDWDLPVAEEVRKAKPYLRALVARPFLPRYFPGYDNYVWLDADTWLQEKFPLKWLMGASTRGSMGLVPQVDRSYRHRRKSLDWRESRMRNYFGATGVALLQEQTYFNAGVFSLRAEAPHWRRWASALGEGLKRTSDDLCDQTALNYAIWNDGLPVHRLPALCNWCCHLALPVLTSGMGS